MVNTLNAARFCQSRVRMKDTNHIRISRRCPAGIFKISRSVVTRFVMTPIKDFPGWLLSDVTSLGFRGVSTAVAVEVDAVLLLSEPEPAGDEEAPSVVSPSAWAAASLTVWDSGIASAGGGGGGWVASGFLDFSFFSASGVGALRRMRIDCSKTSCVRIASIWTVIRVFERRL